MKKAFSILFLFLAPWLVLADEAPKALQSFDNWTLYTQVEDGQNICFIASTPIGKAGNYKSRGGPHIWVRYVSKNIDEVSITSGYTYKTDFFPQFATYKTKEEFLKYKQAMMDDAKAGKCNKGTPSDAYTFDVLEGDRAWLKNVEDDEEAVRSLKADIYAVVIAKSLKDTCSTDVYSLKGFSKAYRKMKESCSGSF